MLSCEESPLFFPNGMAIDSIDVCRTCTLRIVSKLPGPGNIINVETNSIVINENPMNSFIVNGVMYNLTQTILMFRGLHRLPARSTVCDAELCLFFQPSQGARDENLCVCIPVDTGGSPTNAYFATITNYAASDRPVIGSLFTPMTSFISYRGPTNFAGRTKRDPRPRGECDPVKTVFTYYVCLTPVTIDVNDYNRLFKMLAPQNYIAPAEPIAEITRERSRLLTLIRGIKIEVPGSAAASREGGGYSTDAMKCYRVDKKRDIVGDKIYVNGNGRPGNTTLTAEMAAAVAGEDINVEVCTGWSSEIKTWPTSLDDFSIAQDTIYNSVGNMRDGFRDLDKLKAVCKTDDNCKGIFKVKNASNNDILYIPVKKAGVLGTPSPVPNLDREFKENTIINKVSCPTATIKPGDVERVLGIILGVIIGVGLCAVVAYYVLKWTNTNYLEVLKLYGNMPKMPWSTSAATAPPAAK